MDDLCQLLRQMREGDPVAEQRFKDNYAEPLHAWISIKLSKMGLKDRVETSTVQGQPFAEYLEEVEDGKQINNPM